MDESPKLTDVLHLPEGAVTVTAPASLSEESVKDLGDFLELVLRNVQRAASGSPGRN